MVKVHLKGYIVVPAEDYEVVKAELPNHIRLTRAEAGCESFSVEPSASDPHRFNVAETFVSKPAFEAHQARVQASRWGEVTQNVERFYEISEEE